MPDAARRAAGAARTWRGAGAIFFFFFFFRYTAQAARGVGVVIVTRDSGSVIIADTQRLPLRRLSMLFSGAMQPYEVPLNICRHARCCLRTMLTAQTRRQRREDIACSASAKEIRARYSARARQAAGNTRRAQCVRARETRNAANVTQRQQRKRSARGA